MARTSLAQGYRTTGADTAEGWEQLFAILPDGRVFQTGKLSIFNTMFAAPNRAWTQIDEMPDGAEWIGNYPPPV
jgi:hypothetical protein